MAEPDPAAAEGSGSAPARAPSPRGWIARQGRTALRIYIIVMIVAATILADRLVVTALEQRHRRMIGSELQGLANRLDGQLIGKALMAQGLVTGLRTDPDLSAAKFNRLASQISANDPSVINVAISDPYVFTRVFPIGPNRSVIGRDLRDQPQQMPGVTAAISRNSTIIVGPVNLIQGGRGFILRSPIYLPAEGRGNARLWGLASVVFDAEQFFALIGLTETAPELMVALRKISDVPSENGVIYGPPEVFDQHPVVQTVTRLDATWVLAAVPAGGWQGSQPAILGTRALFVALGTLAGLLIFYLLSLIQKKELAQRQLRDAIEALNDGFALYDADDRLVTCNERYREFYRLSADAMTPGRKFEDIIRIGAQRGQYPAAEGRVEEFVAERMALHRRADTTMEQLLEDGTWLRVSERRSTDGGTVGFRVDVTELKRAQQAAERANRAKTEFLSVVSHELRTPLTAVLGYNAFLRRPELLPEVRRLRAALDGGADAESLRTEIEAALATMRNFAEKANTSGQLLLTIINDILDVAKIEAGKMQLESRRVSVDMVVGSVLEQMAPAAAARGIGLDYRGSGLEVCADEIRLRQILINLVGNAVKFTNEGEVAISARPEGPMAVITVRDTGIGMPPEALATIFDSFQQVDSSSSRRSGGTGLGLTITRRLIEMHGGSIKVESTQDHGSTFTFTIPIAPADAFCESNLTGTISGFGN